MGIIDLVLLPLSLVFAIMGAMRSEKKADIFCILSFVFCAIPPIGSVFDMNRRVFGGDIAGILDIYPVMGVIFVIVFVIVTVINVMRVMKRER